MITMHDNDGFVLRTAREGEYLRVFVADDCGDFQACDLDKAQAKALAEVLTQWSQEA